MSSLPNETQELNTEASSSPSRPSKRRRKDIQDCYHTPNTSQNLGAQKTNNSKTTIAGAEEEIPQNEQQSPIKYSSNDASPIKPSSNDALFENLKSSKRPASLDEKVIKEKKLLLENGTLDCHHNYLDDTREMFDWVNKVLISSDPNLTSQKKVYDVKELDASKNYINSFDMSCDEFSKNPKFSFTTLRKLVLSANASPYFPKNLNLICGSSLRELYLSNNCLTNISKELMSLVNLEVLDLRHNRITKIEFLDNCVNLKWFSISCNCITSLDGLDKCKNLGNLEFFGAFGNELTDKEHCFDILKLCVNLKKISISANPIFAFFNPHTKASVEFVNHLKKMVPTLRYVENQRIV